MKSSISKKTQDLLKSFEVDNNVPESYYNENDPIANLIYSQNLRIKAIHLHKDLDLMLVILTNGKVLQRKISLSQRLQKADEMQLANYELIGKGTGIHWPDVDEDLSLKGFLEEEITRLSRILAV